MIRHVLFDLDGTLIDTWRLYMEAYRLTFEEFFGRPFEDSETLALLALRPRSETWLLQMVLGTSEPSERGDGIDAFARFVHYYYRLHDSHFDGPYAGIPAMLGSLRADGYRLGIVTGKSRQAWTITESKVPLVPFDVVITESEVRHAKPDPEGLLTAAAALGGTGADTIYVGDSLLDGEAAAAAGIPFWAAAWAKGWNETDDFVCRATAQGAARVLPSPADLLTALRDGSSPRLDRRPTAEK